jgi:hypothetical protein
MTYMHKKVSLREYVTCDKFGINDEQHYEDHKKHDNQGISLIY